MLDLSNAVTVGNHDFLNITPEQFISIPPIPTNRNSEKRVPKMKATFDGAYAAGQVDTLTEVAIGLVEDPFTDPDTGFEYKTGDTFTIDGNTRAHYWKMYPERMNNIKKGVTAKIHYLSSMSDVEYAYYPYNNAKSTEKKNEVLQGLARRYNWQPRQTMFANGSYGTALEWAVAEYPGDKTKDVFESFNMVFDQLKVLDGLPKGSGNTISKPALKPLKSQAIIGAFLLALRIHPNNLNLLNMIDRIANIDTKELNDCVDKNNVDPVQIIALEWTGRSILRSTNGDPAELWLKGYAGDTKYASQKPQMDFLLYWISKYIENPKESAVAFTKGVKSNLWQNVWEEFLEEAV
jgi:hypothetical protein